jgi:hypothetical protein
MKKVVRLNESDIVRLVKRVINENKRMLNEDEKIDNWVPVGVINPGSQGLLSIEGKAWKMKFPSQNGRDQYLVIKGLWNSGGKICVGNEDWGYIKSYCMSSDEQKEFAGNWYAAKSNNASKFTVKDGDLEFIRA